MDTDKIYKTLNQGSLILDRDNTGICFFTLESGTITLISLHLSTLIKVIVVIHTIRLSTDLSDCSLREKALGPGPETTTLSFEAT